MSSVGAWPVPALPGMRQAPTGSEVLVDLDRRRSLGRLRIAVPGLAPVPVRAAASERAPAAGAGPDEVVWRAGEAGDARDRDACSRYRCELAQLLTRRALQQATSGTVTR